METIKNRQRIGVIVDGNKLEVYEGLTILQALHQEGVYTPHLCYDLKRELRTGNCGKCVVEITENNITQVVRACETPIKAGMVICTNNPRLESWRKGAKAIKH
jgi:formate dehydrogenase major subunit